MSSSTINPDTMLANLVAGIGQTPNPWFTVANQFLPRNLHDIIRWSRYITIQSPTTTEVIRKLSTYPITEFITETGSEEVRKKYESIYKSFKLKQSLQDIGFDYYTIGNVFVSIYFPIHRSLVCPSCQTVYNAKNSEFVIFKNFEYEGTCPKCDTKTKFIRRDTKSTNIADMNIIKWTQEHIVVGHNPITGESCYYYKIPNDIKRRILLGDRLYVDSTPWGFIEAVKKNQDFKFDNNNIFHLRNLSTGGLIEGCSIPPLISLYSLVFYQATLRKANEAIATEHMNPMRVVYPQPGSANNDPVVSMSLKNFVNNMQDAIKKHKRDKNYFLVAPAPIGYSAIGGEGKNLLVSQEIQQAEESILLSLGVSRELLSGLTNWTSSTVGLRMLENTMLGYTTQITELVNWLMTKVAVYLNITPCKITLVPFKLCDDDATKNILQQLSQGGQVSFTTLFESMGLDYREELERMKEDLISRARMEVEAKFESDQATYMSAKKTGDKLDQDTSYQAILTQAESISNELMSLDPAQAQEALSELKINSYPLYIMVSKLLQEKMEGLATNNEMMGVDPNAAQAGAGGTSKPKSGGSSKSKSSGSGSGGSK